MIMKPLLRRLALTAHVSISVGWLGAVVAYIALAITGLTAAREQTFGAAYLMMETIGWSVLVPLCVGALLTGVVQSLGTEWGLFRHYWIVAKLALTAVATTILLLHMPAVSRVSSMASDATVSRSALGHLPMQDLVHATGGLSVLVAVTMISIYKPWGRTPYGQRKLTAARAHRSS